MRMLAGAIVVLAAAIIFSTGAVLVGLGSRSEGPGGLAMFVAAIVGIIGASLLFSGTADRPANPFRKVDD
jgi:hypothetical protein